MPGKEKMNLQGGEQEMKKKETVHTQSDCPTILETENLASATECTGLTPAAIQTPDEAENYSELYCIHKQKPAWKRPDRKEQNQPEN